MTTHNLTSAAFVFEKPKGLQYYVQFRLKRGDVLVTDGLESQVFPMAQEFVSEASGRRFLLQFMADHSGD